MAHPVNWPKKTFFYPIGNTPPVCFTHGLAPEENAEILLLACGDPRSILYTVHADLSPEFRKLDFTCCDWEPAVLARNILLLTMIADGISPVDAWPIFYHFFLDRKSYDILLTQCRALIQSASNMDVWKSSKYGAYLRFCTEYSLAEIRRHWVLYLETSEFSDKDQKALKTLFHSGMKSVLDRGDVVVSAVRSAGPVGVFSIHEQGSKSFREFWTTGVTSSSTNPKLSQPYINPTFLYSLSGKRFNVHYGTDPILAFHLASATGDIKGVQSPPTLSPKDLVASSMEQFRSWCSSFKRRITFGSHANILIRFFVGETLAFCRALNICKELKVVDTGVYVSPWSGTQIRLNFEEYGGTSPTAPLTFNVIDTSNLTDHAGLLNILIGTVPLLQRKPWSVLHTNTLLVTTFENGTPTSGLTEKACGDVPTLSLLLGIAPFPNLFHFTTHSNKHEVLLTSAASFKSGQVQVHESLAWKFPACIVANSASLIQDSDSGIAHPSIICNAHELADFLFSVYLRMFASENQFQNLLDLGTKNTLTSYRKQVNVHYTRASFVGLLTLVRARVLTEWSRAMDRFVDLVAAERTLLMGLHAYQDLVCELYMRKIHSLDVLDAYYLERARGPHDRFFGWKEVPSIVCIVLKVPRHYLHPLEEIDVDRIGTPMLQCESGNGNFHNIHTSVQLIFGELEVSNVAGERSAIIKEDPQGWDGKSPLIATFYLPSWILTISPKETKIGLHIRNTPQSLMFLMDKLGMRLAIYSTSLSDTEHVEVLRQRPDNIGEVDRTRRLSSLAFAGADGGNGKVSMAFDPSGRKATTLTIRDNIRTPDAAKSLADKAEVTMKPLADCTILASYAQHQRHFVFPFPVHGAAAKLRIARKSSYLEIEAPIRPHFEDFLDLSLNPFSIYHDHERINLLNIHYLNLDAIPALRLPSTKNKLQWLSVHMGMTLSEAEKQVKERPNQEDKGPMVNLKESIATIFIKYSGLGGPQHTRMPFGLYNPIKGVGVYTLIFVNDIKLDLASHTVVVDACVVPLIKTIMPKISPVLGKLSDRGLIQIVTLEDETRVWRLLLPAFAERCRTWKHLDTCEYREKGIPAEVDGFTVSPLCSCGRGKNLGSFGNVPDWKLLRDEATRVAIGPLFTFSFMEGAMTKIREAMDVKKVGKTSGDSPSSSSRSPHCARCGGSGKPTLLACSVCKNTKYCSKDCQKIDWKNHKLQCIRAS